MKKPTTVCINTAPGNKTRWVRQAQREGKKLSVWMADTLNAASEPLDRPGLKISIPDDVDFAELRLTRDTATGAVEFNWAPIEAICMASGIAPAVFTESHEDNVSGLIVQWYEAHRAQGGAADPVAETLIAEVLAEDEYGRGRVIPGSGRVQ